MIWPKEYKIETINQLKKNTIHEPLGIEITAIGDDYLEGTMPIDNRTKQPAGILHGGASVVLAESLGSIACSLMIDKETHYCVGQSIFANHIRPGISGLAHGKATPIHLGRKSQIWQIDLTNDEGKLICTCRLTMAILPK